MINKNPRPQRLLEHDPKINWQRRRDSNPRTDITRPNPLAGDPLEPLEDFSRYIIPTLTVGLCTYCALL